MEMKRNLFSYLILTSFLLLQSCSPKIYQSDGGWLGSKNISNYKYVIMPEDKQYASGSVSSYGGHMNSKSINPDIEGIFNKINVVPIQLSEISMFDKNNLSKAMILRWSVTKKNMKGIMGAFSQEVAVTLIDYNTKEIIYKGIGEAKGQYEIDDIFLAIKAALKPITNQK
jgi:hypothetical protein